MRHIGAISLVVIGTFPAMAAELPSRKAGLWEVTMSVAGRNLPGGSVIKQCIDAATDQMMQQNAADMRSAIEQRGQELNSMTALQNMQSYTHLADVHAEEMRRLTAAFEQLYNSMTPEQRQNADWVFRYRAETRASRHGNAHG